MVVKTDQFALAVREFYPSRFALYGRSPEAVGWPNREKQELRFAVLCEVGPLESASLLDVGCGLGDLKGYLKKNRFSGQYCGIDLCDELVQAARQDDPDGDYRTVDLLTDGMTETFDYVIASGLFGLNIGENVEFRQLMLQALWDRCRIGMAVNMISRFVDYEEAYLAYTDPGEALAFCLEHLTRRAALRHDYLPNDFTLYLYKDPETEATP